MYQAGSYPPVFFFTAHPPGFWQNLAYRFRSWFSIEREWEEEQTFSMAIGLGHVVVVLLLLVLFVATCNRLQG